MCHLLLRGRGERGHAAVVSVEIENQVPSNIKVMQRENWNVKVNISVPPN